MLSLAELPRSRRSGGRYVRQATDPYSLPIECTDRDAAFVLDGLLYNESEFEIEERYTDTHGYTEINFADFAMLGLRFCPRVRGVQHQRIYRDRSQPGLRVAYIFGQPRRPDHRH
jgi:TnpA family transposase